MTTPGPATSTDTAAPAAAGAAAATDPFAPSTQALRVFAGLGLLLLAVAYGAFLFIVLNQAYSGDGASGPFLNLAQGALGLSAVPGLLALCLPGSAMSHGARRGAVRLQYALALAGPVLAAIDFS